MKSFISYCCCLLVSLSAFSQQKETSKTIEIDYLSDADRVISFRVKHGSTVGLKINNINTSLVTINKNVQKANFNENIPSLFETFGKTTLPDAGAGASHGLSPGTLDIFSGNNADFVGAHLPEPLMTRLRALREEYKRIGTQLLAIEQVAVAYGGQYKFIRNVLAYQQRLLDIKKTCNRKFDDVIAEVVKETSNYFMPMLPAGNPDRLLLAAGSNYEQGKGIIDRFIIATLATAERQYKEITRYFLPSNIDRLTKAIEAINKEVISLEADIKTAIKADKKSDHTSDKNLLAVLTAARFTNDLGGTLADLQAMEKNSDFPQLQKDLDEFGTKGKSELLDVYGWFNISHYTCLIDPEDIESDEVTIKATIVPKEDVVCAPFARSYKVKVRPTGKLKLDFSTGLFINIGGNNFRDQSYRYDTVAGHPDQSVIVKNKSKNAFFPSVGALMHLYIRNGKDFHLAGTFGLSTKDIDKVNFHFGGSAIFGYSNRFILSTGLTISKATLIDDSYKVGQVVEKASAPTTIPTSSFNRFGYFASFTYNFTAK